MSYKNPLYIEMRKSRQVMKRDVRLLNDFIRIFSTFRFSTLLLFLSLKLGNNTRIKPIKQTRVLRLAKDPRSLHADSEDSDQTGLMPRLIRVFAGRTVHLVGFIMLWLK